MSTYFPMTGFKATVCAWQETIDTTVPLQAQQYREHSDRQIYWMLTADAWVH